MKPTILALSLVLMMSSCVDANKKCLEMTHAYCHSHELTFPWFENIQTCLQRTKERLGCHNHTGDIQSPSNRASRLSQCIENFKNGSLPRNLQDYQMGHGCEKGITTFPAITPASVQVSEIRLLLTQRNSIRVRYYLKKDRAPETTILIDAKDPLFVGSTKKLQVGQDDILIFEVLNRQDQVVDRIEIFEATLQELLRDGIVTFKNPTSHILKFTLTIIKGGA